MENPLNAVPVRKNIARIIFISLIFTLGWTVGWYSHVYRYPDSERRTQSRQYPTDEIRDYARAPSSPVAAAPLVTQPQAGRDQAGVAKEKSEFQRFAELLTKGDYSNAIDRFSVLRPFLEKDEIESFTQIVLHQADRLAAQGQFQSALQILELYLKSEYSDTRVLELQATVLRKSGNLLSAIRSLYDARSYAYQTADLERLNAAIRSTTSEYAGMLQSREEYERLVELFQLVTNIEPDYAPNFIALAKAQIGIKDYVSARNALMLVAEDARVSEEAKQLIKQLDNENNIGLTRQNTAVVPLHQVGDHYYIQASINGRFPIRLLLDTGASLTIIKPSALLSSGAAYKDSHNAAWFNTANGQVQAPIYTVDSLEMGGLEVREIEIGALEFTTSTETDGLLGMNILKHFHFFIDQNEKVLKITPR